MHMHRTMSRHACFVLRFVAFLCLIYGTVYRIPIPIYSILACIDSPLAVNYARDWGYGDVLEARVNDWRISVVS